MVCGGERGRGEVVRKWKKKHYNILQELYSSGIDTKTRTTRSERQRKGIYSNASMAANAAKERSRTPVLRLALSLAVPFANYLHLLLLLFF